MNFLFKQIANFGILFSLFFFCTFNYLLKVRNIEISKFSNVSFFSKKEWNGIVLIAQCSSKIGWLCILYNSIDSASQKGLINELFNHRQSNGRLECVLEFELFSIVLWLKNEKIRKKRKKKKTNWTRIINYYYFDL